MAAEVATYLVLGLLFFFIAIGIPLAIATMATAIIVGWSLFGFNSILLIANRIYDASTNYVLIAVPLFILMGVLMERGGIARRLFTVLHIWSARLPGGMAVGCVFAGAIMAAMVGIVGAEIITLGLVATRWLPRRSALSTAHAPPETEPGSLADELDAVAS